MAELGQVRYRTANCRHFGVVVQRLRTISVTIFMREKVGLTCIDGPVLSRYLIGRIPCNKDSTLLVLCYN